ncbi:acyl-CoA dehydrogenase family protein [Streptomyces purpurogeneiscleroticus]|uniref:acyl-CoA dehydrogenase family protein n=1 Tax=Streptomyces purpurogeneiscleroticus TaxID=68259 RepID=UPI001CBBF8AB|nr:acyl-CoA dehydrogenase family protein [Streptomyces purpurogeneiscleroticus]MBZ4016052.1 acyl-CoA dehydrogenase [Streptomyces purpurogeneiscleroticus]
MEFDWTTEQTTRFEDTLKAVSTAFPLTDDGPPADFYRREDWLRLGELGFLGLSVPTRYGGSGLGALETAHLVEALGRGCGQTGLVFGANAHLFACAMPLAEFATEETRRRLLPSMCTGEAIAGNAITEETAGSDVAALTTTAHRTTGGWILNGEKSFVSNGPAADLFLTYALTDRAAGPFATTAFVVQRTADGLTVGEPFAKMGLSQCPAGGLRFENCFVPDSHVLGEPGQGGIIFQHSMGWERTCLFAAYLGLADRLLEQCLHHVRQRRQFGRPLTDFQAVTHRIADMKLRTEAARLLLYRACWEKDQERPHRLATALSKLALSEGVLASALDTVRIFGARGYRSADGIEAALRDAVPTVLFSGTSDIQRELICKELGI